MGEKLTLWVGLSAVLLASRMQGDDLVANDVVARCDIGWNGHRRGEVVGYTHTHVGQDRDFCAGGKGKKGEKIICTYPSCHRWPRRPEQWYHHSDHRPEF